MAGKKAKPKSATKKPNLEQLKPAEVLCPICRSILIEPVLLPCNHAFCKQCFEDTMENANLVCPLCRLRVGSWLRLAKREGRVVNEEFWKAIQQQYPVEISNKHEGIENDIEEEKPIIIVANPGEIRKEYEKEKQKDLEELTKIRKAEEDASASLLKKIKEEEEYQQQVEEEKIRFDVLLAKKLAEELNTPSTSKLALKKPLKTEIVKQFGPMDRFLKNNDAISTPKLSGNKTDLNKVHSIKSSKKLVLASPNRTKHYLGKKYTCHVLPVEQSPIRVNPANNLFADLDFKGIFGSLGQKPTKTVDSDRDRRKSICTSGYKSSGSGDNSDVIDQECRFYFKPINPQRAHHVPGKVPLKVHSVLGINDGNVPIEPPRGKIADLTNAIKSAFACYPPDFHNDQLNQRAPSIVKIESESSTMTPDRTIKSLKRKTSTENDSPAKKKDRRHLILKQETKSLASPFYGFENKPRSVVLDSSLYKFNTSQIEESERIRNAVNRQVSKYEDKVINKHVPLDLKAPYRSYGRDADASTRKTFEIPQKLIIYKRGNSGVSLLQLDRHKVLQREETIIDINRNIPSTSKNSSRNGFSSLDYSLNTKSRSGRILNTALKESQNGKTDRASHSPKVDLNAKGLQHNNINSASSLNSGLTTVNNFTTNVVDTSSSQAVPLGLEKLHNSSYTNGERNPPNYAFKNIDKSPVIENSSIRNPYINSEVGNQEAKIGKKISLDSTPKNSKSNELKLSMGTPPGILDSDSENEIISNLIDTICNPTEIKNNSPITHSMNGASNAHFTSREKKSSPRKTTQKSPKKVPSASKVAKNNVGFVASCSEIVDSDGKSPKNLRLNTIHQLNDILPKSTQKLKITNSFLKSKSSPPKLKGFTAKSSPQKTRANLRPNIESHWINVDAKQKKMQEKADFELARKLQAQFDLIQAPSRTRRGTKRQITLDEMLLG